ncbi:hypothetical protein [Anaerocolumna sp.]|uniref:hypothetical protein n=1 Tax=Anaerocolumna sp. TaxID=2041569 RepID=UPI0028AABAF8|nr:hypothetical protein [Anaerocolumna sp.]
MGKAGAILPTEKVSIDNGVIILEICSWCVFAGANGEQVMYEDDVSSMEFEESCYSENQINKGAVARPTGSRLCESSLVYEIFLL